MDQKKVVVASLHNMWHVPAGLTIADLALAFSGIKGEVRIGSPNDACPGCRKAFTVARKPRGVIRIIESPLVPMLVEFRICGSCRAKHDRGGAARDSFLAAVESYYRGDEARQ